jgi:membrane-associated PAP2 superfamily phosphatase
MADTAKNTFRFYAVYLLPAMAFAGALLLLERTPLDEQISNWFFDSRTHEFPLRYNGFLEIVMHQWTKYLVALVAVTAVAGFAVTFIAPQLKPLRSLFLFIALALMLAPLTVAILKFFSARHCPWNLDIYGGFVPHVGLFDVFPRGTEPGHCFPAGHASTGFCLFAFHFLGRALGKPVLAGGGFALGLLAGLGLGWVRIVQGAHFLSHVLWSGLVCWIVITLLYSAVVGNTRPDISQSLIA